jgi:hypothetical protein
MNKLQAWWTGIRKPRARQTDRDRIRAILVDESLLSHGFAKFLQIAVNTGRTAKISVEVDGSRCEVGVSCRGDSDLVEYFANWAAAKYMSKVERLAEFDRDERIWLKVKVMTLDLGDGAGSENESGSGKSPDSPNADDAPDREGFGA